MVSLRKTARAHSCNEARQKSVRSCLRSSTMQESSVSSSYSEVIHLFSQKATKMEPLEPFIQEPFYEVTENHMKAAAQGADRHKSGAVEQVSQNICCCAQAQEALLSGTT